jgi:glycosyltransferase involved in cell wall biosynthesis
MRVLHIIPSVAASRGGASQAVLEMVESLRIGGVDVDIATTNDDGDSLLDVVLNQKIEYMGVPVIFFKKASSISYQFREFAFSLELAYWLLVNIEKYDLVHIHALFSFPATCGMIIARLKNKPYMTSTHGLLCDWSLQQSRVKKQIYLWLIEKLNLDRSQALHFTDFQEQQEVSNLNLRAPNFVIPLGLNKTPAILNAQQKLRDFLGITSDKKIILFMSRLHPKKGLDYLIQALAAIQDKDFLFLVAGNGEPLYEVEVDRLIDVHGIRDKTKRLGFVSGYQKQLLLQGSDVFALTSHSENFGVVVLEALSSGLPVLLTPGVALSTMVAENKLGYISSLNVPDISSGLQHLLTSTEELQQMGCNAAEYVNSKYSWETVSCQIKKAYANILCEYSGKINEKKI